MDDRSLLQPAAPPQGSVLISGVGASHGLGAAIARRFAAGGYPVVIAGRNAEKLRPPPRTRHLPEPRLAMSSAMPPGPLTWRASLPPAERFAPLAVAVHNAGSNRPAPFLKLSEEQFEASLARARAWRLPLAQAAIPALLRAAAVLDLHGASGSLRGKANFAPFAAAKAALRALAQSVAREFGPQGIHVGHVVVDGGIEGDRLLSLRPQLKDARGPDGMLTSPPSPTPIGCCTTSTAAPGRSNSTCVPGPSRSRPETRQQHSSFRIPRPKPRAIRSRFAPWSIKPGTGEPHHSALASMYRCLGSRNLASEQAAVVKGFANVPEFRLVVRPCQG